MTTKDLLYPEPYLHFYRPSSHGAVGAEPSPPPDPPTHMAATTPFTFDVKSLFSLTDSVVDALALEAPQRRILEEQKRSLAVLERKVELRADAVQFFIRFLGTMLGHGSGETGTTGALAPLPGRFKDLTEPEPRAGVGREIENLQARVFEYAMTLKYISSRLANAGGTAKESIADALASASTAPLTSPTGFFDTSKNPVSWSDEARALAELADPTNKSELPQSATAYATIREDRQAYVTALTAKTGAAQAAQAAQAAKAGK